MFIGFELTVLIIFANIFVISFSCSLTFLSVIITGFLYVLEGTTIISTPTRIKARNYATKLKFEEGTYYPEFHFVRVKITVNK